MKGKLTAYLYKLCTFCVLTVFILFVNVLLENVEKSLQSGFLLDLHQTCR